MSNGLKVKMQYKVYCRKCDTRYKGKHYMVFKPSIGMYVCPTCGAIREPKELREWKKEGAKV